MWKTPENVELEVKEEREKGARERLKRETRKQNNLAGKHCGNGNRGPLTTNTTSGLTNINANDSLSWR